MAKDEQPHVLPKWVAFKHGAYYLRHRKTKNWIHLGRDYQQAMKNFVELHPDGSPLATSLAEVWMLPAFRQARTNARKRRMAFEISFEDAVAAAVRSNAVCELTGIPFDISHASSIKGRRPYAPSIDRINSEGIYEPSNIRIVCAAINVAMGAWGEDVFRRICEAFLSQGSREKTKECGLQSDSYDRFSTQNSE